MERKQTGGRKHGEKGQSGRQIEKIERDKRRKNSFLLVCLSLQILTGGREGMREEE